MIHTADKLADWQAQVNASDSKIAGVLMAEVRYLTDLVTVVQAQRMFDRFQSFSGIRDDCCPACGGRVRIDEDDPARLRIISDQRVRAS